MARSHVLVPSAGTIKLATNQYTDGANVKDDEVVTQGEAVLPTFTAIAGVISAATANSHLIQLAASASLNLYIRRITITQAGLATAAALADIMLLRLTTIGTGGTAVSPTPMNTLDTPGFAVMSLPTAKGTETGVALYRESVYFLQTMPVSGAPGTGKILDWDFDRLREGNPRVPLSGIIVVKLITAVAAATVTVNVVCSEAPY